MTTLRPCLAGLMLASLAACSQATESAPAAPIATTSPDRPVAAATATLVPGADHANGDCDLVTIDQFRDAFGGKLTASRATGVGERGAGCTFHIAEVSESQLVLQVGNQADYDMRKQSFSSQSRITMEPLALGAEGFVVNGAQVIALREDGRSISVGLMLLTFDQPVPLTDEEARAGVVKIAQQAMDAF